MGEPAVDPTPRAAASYPATSYPATSSPGERAVPATREVRGTPAPREVRGAAVLLRRVTKQYPGQSRAAVGGLTLEVPAGDVVTLVGPPGCGKTTVLRMVNRLLDPSSGSVLLDGEDVAGMDERALRRGIGFMLRTGGLFPHMTVAANTALVPRMLGWPRRRTAARVAEVLELVGLDPATDGRRHPAELSPGQHERAGLARALAAEPRVLLLDDPFGAVDPATRHTLQRDLLGIQRRLGLTVVCATGDLTEATTLGDRVAVLDRGARLVRYDTPDRQQPAPAGDAAERLRATDGPARGGTGGLGESSEAGDSGEASEAGETGEWWT